MDQSIKVTSKKFALSVRDFLRGAAVSVGTAAFTVIQQSFEAGNLAINWKPIAVASGAAFFAYLVKNYFTPATVQKEIPNDQVAAAKAGTIDPTAAK